MDTVKCHKIIYWNLKKNVQILPKINSKTLLNLRLKSSVSAINYDKFEFQLPTMCKH
jgi:hypothetical protein